jgi:hypothetical protein
MKKKSVGLLELEMANLECFLEKSPLSPLGVNKGTIDGECSLIDVFVELKLMYKWGA